MRQVAPDPDVLYELVKRIEYRPGWSFHLADLDRGQGSEGLTLIIQAVVPDSYNPRDIRISHYMPVPPASFNEQSWRRWLLEQIILVETHEACEFLKFDGERPYAPHHGHGEDPYVIFEVGTEEAVRTSFRNEVKPAA
jgi:hypothetical protein